MTTTENNHTTSPDVARGEYFYRGLLDDEVREVPVSLRSLSAGHLEPAEISPTRYYDPGFHQLEVERVWSRTWQMACREEQIPEVGDSLVYEVADTSLIVTRTAPSEIRAYHNSCLHRGTQLRTKPGRVDRFRCPYHGFTWNLDGTLAEVPCEWDFPDLDKSDYPLPEALVGTWGGFVFVNVDTDAAPLDQYLETLPEHFAAWPLEDRYLSAHTVRTMPCNWKVAVEAFFEVLDRNEYFLFPNFMPWAGYLTPFAYRFRPDGHDPDSCVIDIMKLDPVPENVPRPKAAKTRYIGEGETWADAPELGVFGRIFSQDGSTFGRVQRGLRASTRSWTTRSRHQESHIRHFHATLGACMDRRVR